MVFKNLERCYLDEDDVIGMTFVFPRSGLTATIEAVDGTNVRTDVGRMPRSEYRSLVVCLKSRKAGSPYPRV